ncbi:hypothetical protein, partial [Escherichia coli]|uniref:hypothetical protein n=1 Tax=Escherichia coli TaxID=562 RepID=UPI001BDC26E7
EHVQVSLATPSASPLAIRQYVDNCFLNKFRIGLVIPSCHALHFFPEGRAQPPLATIFTLVSLLLLSIRKRHEKPFCCK